MLVERILSVGEAMTYVISGRVTGADLKLFRGIIADIEGKIHHRIVLDLTCVEFIDSTSFGMLLLLRDSALSNGINIALKGIQEPVLRPMRIARFDLLFEMI